MESRQFVTVAKPPAEMFESDSFRFQESAENVTPGQFFDRMEYPEEGGMLLYYYDHPYPFDGQPFPEAVDSLHPFKKFVTATALFCKRHYIAIAAIAAIPRVFTRPFIESFVELYLKQYIFSCLYPYFLAPKRYCKAAGEIHRAGMKAVDVALPAIEIPSGSRIKQWRWRRKQRIRAVWRDLCSILISAFTSLCQWDNAYRYRIQDTFGGETNKEEFIKNPSKEVARLAALWTQRERGWYDERKKYVTLGKVMRVGLILFPEIKRFMIAFVKEIDFDKVKMDAGDEYHNLIRPDYDIHGWPIEFRQKKYVAIMNEYQAKYPNRIEEGKNRRIQLEAVAQMRAFLEKENGTPFMIFYYIREEGGINVKIVETKISTENPKLREACQKLMLGEGLPQPIGGVVKT